MPMIVDKNRVAVLFGSGDMAVCPCGEVGGDRFYVLFKECEEGVIGDADETGREFPVKKGDMTYPDEKAITFEFENRESLDVVIHTLQEYGKQRFPEG